LEHSSLDVGCVLAEKALDVVAVDRGPPGISPVAAHGLGSAEVAELDGTGGRRERLYRRASGSGERCEKSGAEPSRDADATLTRKLVFHLRPLLLENSPEIPVGDGGLAEGIRDPGEEPPALPEPGSVADRDRAVGVGVLQPAVPAASGGEDLRAQRDLDEERL